MTLQEVKDLKKEIHEYLLNNPHLVETKETSFLELTSEEIRDKARASAKRLIKAELQKENI